MFKKKILIVDGVEQTVSSIFDVLIPSGIMLLLHLAVRKVWRRLKVKNLISSF
jgi:cellobiose-specific phosphotransferase system component IIC